MACASAWSRPRRARSRSLVARDGVFGFRQSIENRKACCEIRKVRPLNRELKGAQGWIAGIRREHSADRAHVPLAAWDEAHALIKVNPLADWTSQELTAYIAANNVPGQSAARSRLRLDRLRALHPRGAARRGPARRALVVGARGEEGVRDSHESQPQGEGRMTALVSHLKLLEAESIHIFREAAAQFRAPVLLYSIGKDSTVLLHLARKAFWPAKPPFPLLHVDTTWKFRDMIAFRDKTVRDFGLDLIVHTNHEGLARNINPFDHPPSIYTDVMKTVALRQALDAGGFDAAFGGARRDEEASRAKERVFSFRSAGHRWEPRRQRPEMWQLLNGRLGKGETVRIFPLSNWTEGDVWRYIALEKLDVVPLYFADVRPVVTRNGQLIVVDDERMRFEPGEKPEMRKVRFRTLGCWPLTAAIRVGSHRPRSSGGGDARGESVRAGRASDRSRSSRRHGDEEARGLFLMHVAALREEIAPAVVAVPAPQGAGMVRLLTCGSVDDGKSTLIGRLLWDAAGVTEDQRAAIALASHNRAVNGEKIDFSLLLDGLQAEREQGITIDIAWRYFETPDRRFVIIDSPGHEQYTRNMATGASHADLAILLVDARHGPKRQTRRHAAICDLVGIKKVILAVNKMDLVDFAEDRYREIESRVPRHGRKLRLHRDHHHPGGGAVRR